MPIDYSRFDAIDDEEDKVAEAEKLKAKGSAYFKAGDYPAAKRAYTSGLHELPTPQETKKIYGEERVKVDKLRVVLLCNRAAVHLKLILPKACIDDCTQALKVDEASVKALYRRAQAHEDNDDPKRAFADLLRLTRLDPSNKAAMRKFAKLRKTFHPRSVKAMVQAFEKEVADKKKKAQEEEDKARREAATAKTDAAGDGKTSGGNSSSKGNAGSKSGTRKASSSSSNVERDDGHDDDGGGGSGGDASGLRGYKKMEDGRTTSYFHREISNEARELIGDIAPKQIGASSQDGGSAAAAAAAAAAATGSGSAWNSAGTWEEVDATAWVDGELKATVAATAVDADAEGSSISVGELKEWKGHASVPIIRGRRRHIFEFSFELKFKATLGGSSGRSVRGTLMCHECASDLVDAGEEIELEIKKLGDDGCSSAERKAVLAQVARLRQAVNARVVAFHHAFKAKFAGGGKN